MTVFVDFQGETVKVHSLFIALVGAVIGLAGAGQEIANTEGDFVALYFGQIHFDLNDSVRAFAHKSGQRVFLERLFERLLTPILRNQCRIGCGTAGGRANTCKTCCHNGSFLSYLKIESNKASGDIVSSGSCDFCSEDKVVSIWVVFLGTGSSIPSNDNFCLAARYRALAGSLA